MELPSKLRILFVDDESNILEGLKRVLRSKRKEWDMYFCKSAHEALEFMAKNPVEIIVSDMRMPEVSGFQLLSKVKNAYPNTVRIVLSGYSETEMVLKTVMLSHQYLHKPIVPEMLMDTIERAFHLRALLREDRLRLITSKIGSLPSLPSVYKKLMDVLVIPDVSNQEISEVIKKDISMVSKLLQVSNSAFFNVSHHVSNLEEAVAILGVDTIRALVLSEGMFQSASESLEKLIPLEKIWDYSLRVALRARAIAEEEDKTPVMIDQCFMSGLLHKVGIVLLADNFPQEYETVINLSHEKKVSLVDAEREVFKSHHGEVGGHLLSLWGLPDPIVESVAYCPNPVDSEFFNFLPLTSLHIASSEIAQLMDYPDWLRSHTLDLEYLLKIKPNLKEAGYCSGYISNLLANSENCLSK